MNSDESILENQHLLNDLKNLLNKGKIKQIKKIFQFLRDFEEEFLNSYKKRKSEGVYYTNTTISQFIVEKTLKIYINDLFSIDLDSIYEIRNQSKTLREKIFDSLKKIKICDPACGSGVFIITTAKLLYKIISSLKLEIDQFKTKKIILKNLYGLDINPRSINLCRLKLLKWVFSSEILEDNEIINNLNNNFRIENSLLISNWTKKLFSLNKFDLILGNPPYGNILSKEEKQILKKRGDFYRDIYCVFLIKSIEWSKHLVGYLIPKSFLLRQSYIEFRKRFLNDINLLEIYDIGPDLFAKATNEVQILIYSTKHSPKRSLTIYDFPDSLRNKVKNQDFDNLRYCLNKNCPMINRTKKFYIYTFEKNCPYCKSRTDELIRIRIKITEKINQLIYKIEKKANINYLNVIDFPTLIRGEEAEGLRLVKKEINQNKVGSCYYIDAKQDLSFYYFTRNERFDIFSIDGSKLKGNNYEYYIKPKLLIKHNNIYPEAIFTSDHVCFTSSVYSLIHDDKDELKFLCALLNSSIIQFYCIFGLNNQKNTTINLNQYMIRHLPVVRVDAKDKSKLSNLVDMLQSLYTQNNGNLIPETISITKKIDSMFYKYYDVNEDEQKLIIDQLITHNSYFKLIYKKENPI
ncbi:MAG: N-6 DNA methylase [Candidatus Lokiarchaeota archaeon]|nr:N-6 DNA methylase [Candidatus Lokiarchaeota archaeon]MBD3198454.1 N-6 DNA methylase [Candidatus Lokiarchaeota archaeon]